MLLIMLIIISLLFSIIKVNTNNIAKISSSDIKFVHMDHSIINDEGATMAIIYYDKPTVNGTSSIALKINEFFEEEYQGWRNGSNRLNEYGDGWMESYLMRVEELRVAWGDNVIKEYPLYNTIESEVVLLNSNILSIKQTLYYSLGGYSNSAFYGSTFSLDTGERIPFDDIVNVNADLFRSRLALYLVDFINQSREESDVSRTINEYYGPNEAHSFDIYVGNHVYQLNYEYYYDGKYFYIPEYFGLYRGTTAEVIKWNGKTGDLFKASIEP